MAPKGINKSLTLDDGREISIETGKLAKQADGSAVVKMGDTMLMATVVSSKEAKEGVPFLPLTVDYQEKFASAGRIPGGFIKREGRLSDYEILISRLVDRAIRPLFPEDYHADTQININLISADPEVFPDALAALAASAAIMVSDIPFNGPVSEARVGRVNGELVINPNQDQIDRSDMNMLVGATEDRIMMVEGELKEISEKDMVDGLKFAQEQIRQQCVLQKELEEAAGAQEKREYSHEDHDEELRKKLFDKYYDLMYQEAAKGYTDKHKRSEAFKQFKQEYKDSLPEDSEENPALIDQYFGEIEAEASRNLLLEKGVRLDGRKPEEIRPIWTEVDYLPAAHGSAIFTRGETQSLTTVTLGTKLDEQMVDSPMQTGKNKFMLHYNFPGFSTGEVKPNRGPSRREVGHGNLAYRALKNVLPEDNPHTIRVVSDILESNGSSSMATVCAGSMALMDSGIPIKRTVSGVAMGLIIDSKGENYVVLSDILGDEDHIGDMDFKVTGTTEGITACQMDIKVGGISYEIMEKALEQAKDGRMHIMEKMNETIDKPRAEFKEHAPRYYTMDIDRDMIGAVIGPGGKVIQDIQSSTGATVVVDNDESGEKGVVSIFANDKDTLDEAVKKVKDVVAVPEIGQVYEGTVKSILPFGAFIEFMPGKDGLLHISEINWERVENIEGIFEEGETVRVKLTDIDKKTGKFKLSRKVLLPKPEKAEDNSNDKDQ